MKTTTLPAGAAKAPATPASASGGPKKGSFAEIMARAAAAQKSGSSKPSVGTIQHKPTEKLTLKEKKARQAREAEELKQKKPGAKGARSGSRPLSRSQSPSKSKAPATSNLKPKKPPIDLGYKGTMRPSGPSETARKGSTSGAGTGALKSKDKGRYAGYTSYSDEEDDDEEDEEEDDYGSESDMEAGMDEVDEEEEFSLREARKEDIKAKQEEERLKREKEHRKKALLRGNGR